MNGKRIYFPYCTIERNPETNQNVAVLFQSKQCLPGDLIDELFEMEFTVEKRKQIGRIGLHQYVDRLINRIEKETIDDRKEKLSDLITEQWPACEFDRWLEAVVRYPWMTASYQAHDDWSLGYRNFELTCMYHATLPMPRKKFENDYGSAFLATKLAVGI